MSKFMPVQFSMFFFTSYGACCRMMADKDSLVRRAEWRETNRYLMRSFTIAAGETNAIIVSNRLSSHIFPDDSDLIHI